MDWSVYIIVCTDGSLYTGITTDLSRRYQQHVAQKGAKYFRGRQPNYLAYSENGHNRSTASKRELEIKRLSREGKLNLIAESKHQPDSAE
jgi:putative endonuclease